MYIKIKNKFNIYGYLFENLRDYASIYYLIH